MKLWLDFAWHNRKNKFDSIHYPKNHYKMFKGQVKFDNNTFRIYSGYMYKEFSKIMRKNYGRCYLNKREAISEYIEFRDYMLEWFEE